ncbi:MAG: CheR family methyltransferase [Thermomicrobiales bacterium]
MSVTETGPEGVTQLVVVGASAGGIEALLTLVESLPADFPAPIVLAQHLDPHHRSQLGSLLQGRSRLPVRTVDSREDLVAGTIYVIPADRDVEISDHQVSVLGIAGRAAKPSIDHLLTSAAHRFGENLIAVILTGTGSDGALGTQAVKAYGGTVVVQNPETARFPGMPLAVPASAVDIVADLESIGLLLAELLSGAPVQRSPPSDDEMRPFLERLRDQTGLDFLAYKRPTIERRLHRRMTAVGAATLGEYRRYLDKHPEERQRLVASFLIKVTQFFRDPEVFDYLRDHVLLQLIEEARERGELRIWSAGCATGEEAYSLAILVADLLGDDLESLPIRIFATDVAPDAVEFARRGIYPATALADVPQAVIARHFIRTEAGYEVRKTIRGLVIFGEHDLGYRAPFPRIDLVLCRNVLIYFTPELQRRALQRFAFALRRGGYLALGKSETVSPLPDYFALEQPRLKVFRRIGDLMPIPTEQFANVTPIEDAERTPRSPAARQSAAHRFHGTLPAAPVSRVDSVLDALSVGVVTVDRHYDVLTINLAARTLLGLQTPAIGEDLIHAVRANLRDPLRQVLDAALHGEAGSLVHHLPPDPVDGIAQDLLITATPGDAAETGHLPQAAVLQIVDVSAFVQRQRELEAHQVQLGAAIEEVRTLRAANQRMASEQGRLRAEVEVLQLAQEEALAAAEEIETLHEEQQATNEELETVNEELQATIEELQTTVAELHARTSDLEEMAATLESQRQAIDTERTRLSAILENMGDAVLVLDPQGQIVLTNSAYDRLFGQTADFTPEDESGALLPEGIWPQQRAARGDVFTLAFTLPGPDGTRRWFESRTQPVQGSSGEHWGVMVIRDITERSLRRQQEQFVAIAAHELRNPLTALSGRLQLLARRLASVTVEERFRRDVIDALAQARRLEDYVHDLLDVTRMQFGHLSLERAPVDLGALAEDVTAQVQPLATRQTIAVDLPTERAIVEGDGRQLEQVVFNLLTNAIAHAPESSRIDLRVSVEDHAAVIEVEDDGPGILPDDLPHIFTQFFKGGSSHAVHGMLGGLGLGLFIAREIVTNHGGTIEALSTVGEGATFVVRLPLLETAGQEA